MKKLFILALGIISTASVAKADNYTITAHLNDKMNGETAYLINYDTEEKIDSAVIGNGIATFKGTAPEKATFASVVVKRRGVGNIIVESGDIVLEKGNVSGGVLNEIMRAHKNEQMKLVSEFRSLPDSIQKERYEEFNGRINKLNNYAMTENINNPVGYMLLAQQLGKMNAEELNAMIEKYPVIGQYRRVAAKKAVLDKKAETGVGRKFKDFEVEYDGKTYRLSDYVGKGKYVLVDFWASWCGPCIRQTAVIKEILKEYGPKGLEVLGIAVWDKPEDTLEGIKSHELPWTNIINAQSIPTEIYGIQGIPCIILFGPDGTILSRDKQSDALKADVAEAMKNL